MINKLYVKGLYLLLGFMVMIWDPILHLDKFFGKYVWGE